MASATSNENSKDEDDNETITIPKKLLREIISAGSAAVEQLSRHVYDNGGYSYEYESEASKIAGWLSYLFYSWRSTLKPWDESADKRSYTEIAEDFCKRFPDLDYPENEE